MDLYKLGKISKTYGKAFQTLEIQTKNVDGIAP